MPRRLALALSLALLVTAPQIAGANPITYNFAGTVGQPYDGASTFTGSLTFDPAPVNDGAQGGAVEISGDDGTTIDLKIGSQSFQFVGTFQDPTGAYLNVQVIPPPNETASSPGTDTQLMFVGQNQDPTTGATLSSFTIRFDKYGPSNGDIPTDVTSLISQSNAWAGMQIGSWKSQYVTLTYLGLGQPPQPTPPSGPTTPIDPVPAPEPGTALIFAGLGLAALWQQHRRTLRGRTA